MFLRRTKARAALAATASALVLLAGCSGGGGAATNTPEPEASPTVEGMAEAQALVGDYPREETVFTSGAQWGPPSSWNPIPQTGDATGTRGLIYEPLFFFDPATLELEPWLAESGEWTDENTYVVTLREGLTWHDGEALDAQDVVFTAEVGKNPAVPYSNLWNWLESAKASDDTTVEFTFSDPRPQEWDRWLYSTMVVPEHIMSKWSGDELISNANENPVGSGSFTYSAHGQDRMVLERNEEWWGIEALGIEMPMRYVVDIVNTSNEVALGLMLQNGLDLSNNFLPGINVLADQGQVGTYYEDAPYMLSANTAWLVPNTTKKPMDDVAFRRAMAFAIDVDSIVESAYGGIVQKAHPSGLLPAYEQYYDEEVVAEHGFEHDPEQAASILADAGYEDGDGDGFVETPDGEPIELSLIVPSGWTDWMEAARVIAESLSEAGINVTAEFPDSGAVDDARATGNFDLMINNFAELTNTPWSYYNRLNYLPIQEQQLAGNYQRLEDKEAWQLTETLSRTPDDDPAFAETMSQLQEISLRQMPVVPLWYNGAWAQYNESTWTNWPTEGGESDSWPITWGGYWQLGGLETLANLRPAG